MLTLDCFRYSNKLYYISQFIDLYLSFLLTNEARIKKCCDCLNMHFAATSMVPGLLPNKRNIWNNITTAITSSDVFRKKIRYLKYRAATAGELEVISHDETFKTMFCLIGQSKMSQKHGAHHALHTFRGFTGCTLGLSAQRTTSSECFSKAAKATFDDHLTSKVKFIFSDAPKRIFRAAKLMFPSLIAVGEDPIHLPIRLEYCWSGKTTKLSTRVRQLHYKFRASSVSSSLRFWQPDVNISLPTPWPSNPQVDDRTPEQWKTFCSYAFDEEVGYITYVAELAKIIISYDTYMDAKNSDGVTVKQILKNAASRTHYEGLQNASRLFAKLGLKGNRLGTGTTRNEQLHRELKSWMRNIIMCHEQRFQNGLYIFLLAKLLTHSSAAYYPSLSQTTQSRLMTTIAVNIRLVGFFQQPNNQIALRDSTAQTRSALHRHYVPNNVCNTTSRKAKRKRENVMWKKERKTKELIFVKTPIFSNVREWAKL